ncbi:hypothetical protein [Streptomyces sp. col6]|uniref:hypothetical protein n=1 Tax=Streptomyces sp. col6 TaxID=2478958 RepID=UPI001CD0D8AD|nr:hypothetical protein [Streptomyces sp. col6]
MLASAAGRRAFPHHALSDGAEVDLGGLTLWALATSGHTDEHMSFLLLDGSRELEVFTGGSLIVNSAARAEELARAQYRSLKRLTTFPDETAVWPAHGVGSFCSARRHPAHHHHRRAEAGQPAARRAHDLDAGPIGEPGRRPRCLPVGQ